MLCAVKYIVSSRHLLVHPIPGAQLMPFLISLFSLHKINQESLHSLNVLSRVSHYRQRLLVCFWPPRPKLIKQKLYESQQCLVNSLGIFLANTYILN